MPQQCECNIVANFPELRNLGFISVSLRTNTPVIVTSDSRLKLIGATTGELSVSAYGSMRGYPFGCPGRAGASYDWMQKYNCLSEYMFYIPRGGAKSFVEGDVGVGVPDDVSIEGVVKYDSVQVSAASGPGSVYLSAEQTDGYDLEYRGTPIQVYGRVFNVINSNGVFSDLQQINGEYSGSYYGALSDVLPQNSELFLMNFSWEQTPPNISTVSYSFAFTGADYELLIDPITSITCADGTKIPV